MPTERIHKEAIAIYCSRAISVHSLYCENCENHLMDHEWVDLDDNGVVTNCSIMPFIGERFDEYHEHIGGDSCLVAHKRVINGKTYQFTSVTRKSGYRKYGSYCNQVRTHELTKEKVRA